MLIVADSQVVVVPDPDTVSPGFLGFAVMFVLAVATILLIRSMVTHLRKVRYLTEPEAQPGARSTAPDQRRSGPARPSEDGANLGPAGSGTA